MATKLGVSESGSWKPLLKRLSDFLGLQKKKEAVAYTLSQFGLGMAFHAQKYLPRDRFELTNDGQAIDIAWRESEAINMSCCDCGLVHYIRFVATKENIRMRLWRNKEQTKEERELRGITFTSGEEHVES